jgi:hypothetical protein
MFFAYSHKVACTFHYRNAPASNLSVDAGAGISCKTHDVLKLAIFNGYIYRKIDPHFLL